MNKVWTPAPTDLRTNMIKQFLEAAEPKRSSLPANKKECRRVDDDGPRVSPGNFTNTCRSSLTIPLRLRLSVKVHSAVADEQPG